MSEDVLQSITRVNTMENHRGDYARVSSCLAIINSSARVLMNEIDIATQTKQQRTS